MGRTVAMKRRAHLEMIARDKVRITTAYHQKTFDLNDIAGSSRFRIDLITMKIVDHKTNFYATLDRGWRGDLVEPLIVSIMAHELEEKALKYGNEVTRISTNKKYGLPSEIAVEVTSVEK